MKFLQGRDGTEQGRRGHLSTGREIRKPRTCSGSWSKEPHERKVIDEVSEVGWLNGEAFEHEAEDAGLVPWHW